MFKKKKLSSYNLQKTLVWLIQNYAWKNKRVSADVKRNAGTERIKGYERKKEKHSPINRANFRAKLLRRRRDSDQSAAMHPGSVNAALSAFTSPSLPSLSLSSYKAAHEVHIKAVMDYISSHCERWALGPVQSPLKERGKNIFESTIPLSSTQKRKW